MSRNLIITICAVVVAIFALGYLLIPSITISFLGFNTDPTGLLITQFIGVLSMGYAVILWYLRDSELVDQKPVLLGVSTAMGFAFAVSLFHQIGGAFGNLGWIGVSMFGFTFVLFGYFSIRK